VKIILPVALTVAVVILMIIFSMIILYTIKFLKTRYVSYHQAFNSWSWSLYNAIVRIL